MKTLTFAQRIVVVILSTAVTHEALVVRSAGTLTTLSITGYLIGTVRVTITC